MEAIFPGTALIVNIIIYCWQRLQSKSFLISKTTFLLVTTIMCKLYIDVSIIETVIDIRLDVMGFVQNSLPLK